MIRAKVIGAGGYGGVGITELLFRHPDAEIAAFRTKAQVINLSKELNLASGIVVGRFQRLTGKWNIFNGLKRKFHWAEKSE